VAAQIIKTEAINARFITLPRHAAYHRFSRLARVIAVDGRSRRARKNEPGAAAPERAKRA